MKTSFKTKSGRMLSLRRIESSDQPMVAALLCLISNEARYLRYLSGRPLSMEWVASESARIIKGEHWPQVTLVVTTEAGENQEIVALAELSSQAGNSSEPSGEIAFLVRDDFQGEGIGGWLAGWLVEIARTVGIMQLQVETTTQNWRLQRLLHKMSDQLTVHRVQGDMQVLVHLTNLSDTATLTSTSAVNIGNREKSRPLSAG